MFYRKEETYSFNGPQEYRAYLNFKKELEDAGVKFHDTGDFSNQEIKIITNGRFNVSEAGSVTSYISKPQD